jgi:hypothetical protein
MTFFKQCNDCWKQLDQVQQIIFTIICIMVLVGVFILSIDVLHGLFLLWIPVSDHIIQTALYYQNKHVTITRQKAMTREIMSTFNKYNILAEFGLGFSVKWVSKYSNRDLDWSLFDTWQPVKPLRKGTKKIRHKQHWQEYATQESRHTHRSINSMLHVV